MQRKLNETLLKTERQLKIIDQYVIYSQTDLNGVITAVSDAFCDFSGFKREELIGKNHNIVKSGETAVDVFQNLWGVISEDKTWEGEFINQKKQGKIYYTAVKISPEFNQNGDKIGYIGFFQDITDKIIIKKLAETDHLTKLYNRQKVDRCLDSEYENSLNSQKELSLMMLDIDHFKAVNDTYGHQIGDNVLVDISNILQNNTRKDDIVGRFGGEEFIIILPNTNVEEAKEIAEKLRKIIENNEFPTVGQKTISIGVSSYKDNLSLNDLIKNADEALYKAKNNGRNRVEII